jgi:hypothetical protein
VSVGAAARDPGAGDADGDKFAMFAPPFGRGDAGATLFRSISSGEDGGNSANIAAREASNPTERDARAAAHNGRISVD